jgi:hypothetical protein
MSSQPDRSAWCRTGHGRNFWVPAALLAGLVMSGSAGALAQAYGIATVQPGALNHTTGSAIAKVRRAG